MAGILLVLAFAATALTLSQMADLEKRSAEEERAPIFAFYRDVRTRMHDMLYTSITTTMTTSDFAGPFDRARSYVIDLAHGQSYDAVVELAGGTKGHTFSEWNYTNLGYPYNTNSAYPKPENTGGANYFLRSYDNKVKFDPANGGETVVYDGVNDGLATRTSGCLSGGGSCIQAAIVYISVSDATTTLEEYVVYGLNAP